MSSASKNALQKFTRNLIVPSNSKKVPNGYTCYAPRTDFFVENKFVQIFGTVGYWLEKCEIGFAKLLFIKLDIDVIITVIRALEIPRITGRPLSFEKDLPSATYKLFVISKLNSIYSAAKHIESSTPTVVEMQESLEHIYPSIQILPNNTPNTVSLFKFC